MVLWDFANASAVYWNPALLAQAPGTQVGLQHMEMYDLFRMEAVYASHATPYGNFGVLVRAFTYIRELGGEGLTQATEMAVLNANYLRARLSDTFPPSHEADTLHETVFSGVPLKKETGVMTMEVAKRLMDHGFHPPTVYFPLIVPEALMVEPTETEPPEELDRFVDALLHIAQEARSDPDQVKKAPHQTGVRRLDETRAARKPRLRWTPDTEG